MIDHQNIGMQRDAVAMAIAFQAIEVRVAIGLVMKNRSSSIAAGDHMVERTRELNALSIVLYNEPDARSYIWQYGDEGLEPLLLFRVSLV